MSLYRIYHPATQRVVNLYTSTTGQVTQGTPLSLYPWENNADQRFEMEYRGTSAIFRLERARNMVINRNAQTNAAMVWPFDTSDATLKDSLIDTETESGNTRIKLVKQNLYLTKDANSYMLYWKAKSANDSNQFFKLEEIQSDSGSNYLIYPTKTMRITQRYDGTTSHLPNSSGSPADYPIDEGCEDSGRSWLYCPCDEMVVKRIYTSGTNTIWLESTTPVQMPSGRDYVTMLVIHVNDDDLSKISVGQKFTRKQAMFLEGNDGANAYHFHMSVGSGKFTGNGCVKNSKGNWVLKTTNINLKPENAFYIDPTFTHVKNNAGLPFRQLPN